MKVSIAIPNGRGIAVIEPLLVDISNQTYGNIEVIIASIGSPEITFEEDIKFVRPKNSGANAARNSAISKGSGDLFFLLDDDCRISDVHLIEKWVNWFHANESIDVAGGSYSIENGNYWDKAYNWMTNLWQLAAVDTPHLLGGHCFYKSTVLKNELFNEDLKYGGTETEFHLRLFRKNKSLQWEKQFQVDHRPNLNFVSFCTKAFLQGRARAGFNLPKSNIPWSHILREPAVDPICGLAVYWFFVKVGAVYGHLMGVQSVPLEACND